MHIRFLLILLAIFAFLAPLTAEAAAVINEVLFDPPGTDTGLEKIEIYNPDGAVVDMSGWELYPDGIGYFTFPAGFSLAARSFAVVHLRSSGAGDAKNLYHSAPSTNMGNTSGSVALFNSHSHSKITLVDFTEWSTKGASSTWESYAVDKGLWQREMPIDTAVLQEGNSIGLAADGTRGDASSWRIFSTPSIGSANAGGGVGNPPPSPSPSPSASPLAQPSESAPARPPTASLGANAGPDFTTTAGATALFRGMAFGLDGEPLTQARFLWNFGDGAVMEGRAVTHIYHFPGKYNANLVVSSGEYTGSDWRLITVLPADIFVSEFRPGGGGFVEIFNAADESLDLSSMIIGDGHETFRIPAGTRISEKSAIVFSNALTALDPAAGLIFSDARLKLIEDVKPIGNLPEGASWERQGEKFAVQFKPNPGRHEPVSAGAGMPPTLSISSTANSRGNGKTPVRNEGTEAAVALAVVERDEKPPASFSQTLPDTPARPPRLFFFAVGLAGSFAASLAFLFLRRRLR